MHSMFSLDYFFFLLAKLHDIHRAHGRIYRYKRGTRNLARTNTIDVVDVFLAISSL